MYLQYTYVLQICTSSVHLKKSHSLLCLCSECDFFKWTEEVQGVPELMFFFDPMLKSTVFDLSWQVGCHWKARCGSFVNLFLKVAYEKLLLIGFCSLLRGKILTLRKLVKPINKSFLFSSLRTIFTTLPHLTFQWHPTCLHDLAVFNVYFNLMP